MARASRGWQQQARTIAYALARPLRGLRRGFEVGEHLDHLFPVPALRETDENLTEIIQKRRPEGPKSPRGASQGLPSVPGVRFGPPGAHFWPPGAHFGPPGALLGLSRRSRGAPGSLWGAPWGLQNRSRRPSRRPPAQELDLGVILGTILAQFLDPPGPRKSMFSCGRVAFFEKIERFEKRHLKGETWLSWNGKRVRLEGGQALQARRGQKEQQEQQEQERQDNEQQQGESGESLPRMETASPYDRLCPCAAATRPAPGGLRWERLGRIALLVSSSEILTKSLPEASRDIPELILELLGLILASRGALF